MKRMYNDNDNGENIKQQKMYDGLHVKVPNDLDINDDSLKPFDDLLVKINKEFINLNISVIIERFEPILSEFYELSASYRHNVPKYNKILTDFIDELCYIYNIRKTVMLVHHNKYTTSAWGNVYWMFMHLSSILVSYAYETGRINDFINFPTIIYNIDLILPCSKCQAHFATIKSEFAIKNAIKSIAFGSAINGLVVFHNLVTSNVDKTVEYVNRPNRPTFFISDFALEYQCIELQNETVQKSPSYLRPVVDWQPTTHALLTTLLATYCPQPYSRASNLIKRAVYSNDPAFKSTNLNIRNTDILAFDQQDLFFNRMTSKQIKYCLMKALLLQLQDTPITDQEIKNNRPFNNAIILMYRKHTDFIRQLVELNMPLTATDTPHISTSTNNENDDESKKQINSPANREYILNILDRLK